MVQKSKKTNCDKKWCLVVVVIKAIIVPRITEMKKLQVIYDQKNKFIDDNLLLIGLQGLSIFNYRTPYLGL